MNDRESQTVAALRTVLTCVGLIILFWTIALIVVLFSKLALDWWIATSATLLFLLYLAAK